MEDIATTFVITSFVMLLTWTARLTWALEKYFTACKVSSCTYTHMSASSLAGIAAVIIGLLGGINNAMDATFKVVYAVMRTTIVRKTKVKREPQRPTYDVVQLEKKQTLPLDDKNEKAAR